jgi:DNA topoisomerase-1
MATSGSSSSDSSSSDSEDFSLLSLAKPTAAENKTIQGKVITKKRAAPVKKKQPITKKQKTQSSSSSSSSDSSSSSSSSDSSDSSSDDSDGEKPKRKRKRSSTTSNVKWQSPDEFKEHECVPFTAEMGANKWWNRPPLGNKKWEQLKHNGVLFPPPYEPHEIPILYDGEEIKMTPECEEIASFYSIMIDLENFVGNETFNANFFEDWKATFTTSDEKRITDLKKCDFRRIQAHLLAVRDKKKEEKKDPAVRKRLKLEAEQTLATYGYALVDGFIEKIGNCRVEPPALFRGRGAHPKTGHVKARIMPEDILLNVSPGETIPKCPVKDHKWKGVVHDPTVTWLACWQDSILGRYKYVYLGSNSRFKGESDIAKYEKARKLKKFIGKIRADYTKDMKDSHLVTRKRATAMYLIDFLALRVGNEKDTSEVADTVGCCSLRVEHLMFFDDDKKIRFFFLGKDSMVYDNTVLLERQAYDNLLSFCGGKLKVPPTPILDADDNVLDCKIGTAPPKQNVFKGVSVGELNAHLSSLMPGLSAKVFRTYNASITLQKELLEDPNVDSIDCTDSTPSKEIFYNDANRKVAILCNHQRTESKGYGAQLERMQDRKASLEGEIDVLKKHLKKLKKGKKSDSKIESKLATLENRLVAHESKMQIKVATKTVALGTSKINYMDPRITVAWCKLKHVPLEKIFNKSLLIKFPWAMETKSDWRF